MTANNGKIRVTIQTEDRMQAITELAQAINKLAGALSATPSVHITDSIFSTPDTAISIDTSPEVSETTVHRIGGDDTS